MSNIWNFITKDKNSNENICKSPNIVFIREQKCFLCWQCHSPEALDVVLAEGAPGDVPHGGEDQLARHPGHPACLHF